MDIKELEMILKEGEGYKIEFKEGFNNLDKEIVAFANSSGGRIFLGVTDEGKIKGIGISNELKSRIQDIANNCRPKIKISIDIFEKIFIINVREGDDKPYECSAGFYKRIGSNSQKMTRDEILEFFKSEGKIRFDELIVPEFSFPKDFDENRLLKFLELAVVLTERQERAIEYLRENVFITTRVYASLVDVSERQARYDLNDLVEKNLIIAEGATTTRKYHLRQTSANFG